MRVWKSQAPAAIEEYELARSRDMDWHTTVAQWMEESGRQPFLVEQPGQGARVIGISILDIDMEPPQGWMKRPRANYYTPKARGKGSDEARALLASLQPLDTRSLMTKALGVPTLEYATGGLLAVVSPTYMKVGKTVWVYFGEPDGMSVIFRFSPNHTAGDWDGGEHFVVGELAEWEAARELLEEMVAASATPS